MNLKTTIQFVNHASLKVNHGPISILSDPWYQGSAFHKGWNLLHELEDSEILNLLDRVTHIWISHEHPDHFSISFFKKFGQVLRRAGTKILFQTTEDKRVENFLLASGFDVQILRFNAWVELSTDLRILCFRDGFYDSGLCIETSDTKILNLNDCEIRTSKRCKEVLRLVGGCQVLATQFSYAAWKGGRNNIQWRKLAAREKINTMKLQAAHFKPDLLIPFASYVYFSNNDNFYLNDSSNKPNDVLDAFAGSKVRVKVMKPFEKIENITDPISNEESLQFWHRSTSSVNRDELNRFEQVSLAELNEVFKNYKERLFGRNSKWFLRLVRILSPISVFGPVKIRLNDLGITISLDLFCDSLTVSASQSDISMSSESLSFLMKNSFGFDTLTVNGCFEEESESGFSRAARTLAIESLNNLGIEFRPSVLLRPNLFSLFVSRLMTVSRKVSLAEGT